MSTPANDPRPSAAHMKDSTMRRTLVRLSTLLALAFAAPIFGGCDDGDSRDAGMRDANFDELDAGMVVVPEVDSGPRPDADAALFDAGPLNPVLPADRDLYVAVNGGSMSGTLDRYASGTLEADDGEFRSETNEGIAFDRLGALVQAGDGDGLLASGIRTFCRPQLRIDLANDGYAPQRDRALTPPELDGAKGVAVIDVVGWYVVAASGANEIQVYSQSAAGDAAPIRTVAIPSGATVWDVLYDRGDDRLYASLTDGSVAVYDAFASTGRTSFDRVFRAETPFAETSNFHGLAYDAENDVLVVSDVGAANASQGADFATDGSILVFEGASELEGAVEPSQIIGGPSTGLGNPVDLALIDGTLYVAEKANDMIVTFFALYFRGSGDMDPFEMVSATAPESLAVPRDINRLTVDVTDLDDPTVEIDQLVAVQNPAPNGPDGDAPTAGTFDVDFYTPDLPATSTMSFHADAPRASDGRLDESSRLIENVTLDALGHAYISYSNAALLDVTDTPAGGILIVNNFARRGGTDADVDDLDRVIAGPNTGLVTPKGVEVISREGLLLVADPGAGAILVFSLCAEGDVAPLFVIDDLGGADAVWDVDYDPTMDRLYAAATNGTVLIYHELVASLGSDFPPMRVLTPMIDDVPARNLHGIIYDAAEDTLFVTDVGMVGSTTDGSVYRLTNVGSRSTGEVDVAGALRGASTMLGNPVDLAWDGEHLYVAEKANGRILRFDDALSVTGVTDEAPSRSSMITAVESIALIPETLASQQIL